MPFSSARSPRRAWFMVAVLWFAYVVSYLDRLIISLLIEPIKADFGLSDVQSSLLAGLSFVLFYTGFALPVAYVADRTSRKRIILIGVAVWGVMTALCGTARNFTSLLFFRFGVGAGESALNPSAVSMISDAFEPSKRTLPLALFLSAASAGAAFAYILGGFVVDFANSIGIRTYPFLGEVKPWQTTLFLVALPAALSFVLVLFINEPQRPAPDSAGRSIGEKPIGEKKESIFAHVRRRPAVYAGCVLAPAIGQMATYAFLTWMPSLFMRAHDWPPEKSGPVIGAAILTGGVLGTLATSSVQKLLARRGVEDSAYVGFLLASAAVIIPSVLLPLQGGPWAAIAILTCTSIISVLMNVLPQATLQLIAAPHLRAQVTSIWLLLINVIGFGLGPTGAAMISDLLASDGSQLPLALSIFAGVVLPLALVISIASRGAILRRLTEAAL